MLRRTVLGTVLTVLATLLAGCRGVQDDVVDDLVGEAPEGASIEAEFDVERVEDGARFTVTGEVQNAYDREIDEIEVTAVLLDERDDAIFLESTIVEWVPAAGTKPFELSFVVPENVVRQFDGLTVGMQFPD